MVKSFGVDNNGLECWLGCQDHRLNSTYFRLMETWKCFNRVHTCFWGNPILEIAVGEPGRALRQAGIAVIGHQARTIRLFNHFDCAAYNNRGYGFGAEQQLEEMALLTKHLYIASGVLSDYFDANGLDGSVHLDFKLYVLQDEGSDVWALRSV